MKYSDSKKKTIALELVYSSLMILVGTALPLILYKDNPEKDRATILGLEIIAAVGLGLQFYIYLANQDRRLLKIYLVAVLIAVPMLLSAAT